MGPVPRAASPSNGTLHDEPAAAAAAAIMLEDALALRESEMVYPRSRLGKGEGVIDGPLY